MSGQALTYIAAIALSSSAFAAPKPDYPIAPVPLVDVRFNDSFWSPRLETNRRVTIWYDFRKCEQTGRIDNFAKAGRLMPGEFRGIFFDDSDVFKVIEGASYALAQAPDEKLDKYLDELIAKIAAAQEPDGYLYTARTLRPDNPPEGSGRTRWSNLVFSHELYNVGHLYEAAVAHYHATKKRTLLDVAIKNANLIDSVFGPNGRHDVPGHEEIEIGLVKLFRATSDERYLTLAKFFIDQRGHAHGRKLYGPYAQDHKPLVDQTEAVGHAVRAGYLYAGTADVAALTGDEALRQALDHIWRNVVSKKLAITGGFGAQRRGEAFGDDHQLPNAESYNETCAAIAGALWNHRMFLLEGDAKYIDVLERIIDNGFLSGVSLSGDQFFYVNPLACDGRSRFNHGAMGRNPWFTVSCCPVNVVRFLPSLAGYVYAVKQDTVYANLFVGGSATIRLPDNTLHLTQRTEYPWQGRVEITVDPEKPGEFELRLRIPGWATGAPVPSDLYRFADASDAKVSLSVNGAAVSSETTQGYATIRRAWKKGDNVTLDLPMPVRRVLAHEKVAATDGRVALQRGPIVYCVEAGDHGGSVRDLVLPDDASLHSEHRANLLGGVTVIRGTAARVVRTADATLNTKPVELTAIPYYAWAHRQVGQMDVWLARDPAIVKLPPPPTLASTSRASASHVWQSDTAEALNDQIEPRGSNDQSIPRLTWWDHKGTSEWAQYELAKPVKVSGVEVYWFDDTGSGSCRAPKSWRVLYKSGDHWQEVPKPGAYTTEKGRFNVVRFDTIETTALRLEVQLADGVSAGILEWKVRE